MYPSNLILMWIIHIIKIILVSILKFKNIKKLMKNLIRIFPSLNLILNILFLFDQIFTVGTEWNYYFSHFVVKYVTFIVYKETSGYINIYIHILFFIFFFYFMHICIYKKNFIYIYSYSFVNIKLVVYIISNLEKKKQI